MLGVISQRSLVAASLALVAWAPACQRAPVDNPWFPLAAGRTWRYLVTVEPNDGGEPMTLAVETVGPDEVGGRRVIRQKIELAGETHFRFIASDDRGVYRHATQSAGEPAPALEATRDDLLVLPLERGRTWQGTAGFSLLEGPETVTIESVVESTSETIDVPAGRFPDCIKIAVTGRAGGEGGRSFTLSEQVWYARGIGMVKSIVEESESGPDTRKARAVTELVAHSPAG
jgi:hypothetical protein